MFNLENLDSVTEKFCNEVVSCNYLGKPYPLNEIKNTMQLYNVLFKISSSEKPLGVLWVAENKYIATKTVIEKMKEMYKHPVTFKHLSTKEVK